MSVTRAQLTTSRDVERSGIPPLDELLGGLSRGRAYLVVGATGTGKSIAALQFLASALEQGSRGVLVTDTDPKEVLAQADYLGIHPRPALRCGQLTLLTYEPDFSRRVSRAASPALMLEELRRLIGWAPPDRLVIDSVAPFLGARSSSAAPTGALVEWIEALGATTLITFPGELSGVFDQRLDPLMQRAHAIVRFSSDGDHGRRMEVVKARFDTRSDVAVRFRIDARLGVTGHRHSVGTDGGARALPRGLDERAAGDVCGASDGSHA